MIQKDERAEQDVQKLTDQYVTKVEEVVSIKEKELMAM